MSDQSQRPQDKATGTPGAASTRPAAGKDLGKPAAGKPPAGTPAGDATMLPPRRERNAFESAFVRLIATSGVVGIGVAIGAIMTAKHSEGWIIGLVVALVSVLLSAILWSSRRL